MQTSGGRPRPQQAWEETDHSLRGQGRDLTLKTGQLTPCWARGEAMGLTQVDDRKLDPNCLKQKGFDVA